MRQRLLNGWFDSTASRFGAIAGALLAGTAGLMGAGVTVQDFSGAGGTPYTLELLGGAPAPSVSGGVATLVSDVGSQRNNITFNAGGITSAGGQGLINVSFDYFMPDESTHTGCCGERADGFAFGLLPTATYGSSGGMVGGWGAVEQDALAGALTVGFDIFTGAGSDGAIDDNNIRLGWNGITVANTAFGPAFKLNNAQWNRVNITIATNGGSDLIVNMTIAPIGGTVTQTVFNAVTIPGAFVPASRVIFAGRTGGAFTKVDLDNISVLSSYNPGTAVVTAQPANQTVTESQTATFTIDVDGTPPYTIQWFSNNVAIPGANGLSYTTPVTTTNMNGTIYKAAVTNSIGSTMSGDAVLTVNAGIIAQRATTDGFPGRVRVVYNKPAALVGNYTLNNGATVNSAAYGATHAEVLLTTSPLAPGQSYTVTITGETGEDGSLLAPTLTTLNFTQIGAACADFTTSVPSGVALFGTAVRATDGSNMVIHLTDDAATGANGNYYISNQFGNSAFMALNAAWRTLIGGDANAHADGMSFNWAPDLPTGATASEDGFGSYLSFTIDTWDGGSGPDTGIEIKWRGNRIAFKHIPRTDEGDGNFICRNVYVPTAASVDVAGNVSFTYDTNTISAVIPNWSGVPGNGMSFTARTGGEADNHWIDDLCISNFNLGNLAFVKEPVSTTALEGQAATFSTGVDGSPNYYYQWFTNGVAVAGATNSTYTTAATTEAMQGTLVSVNVSNLFSSVTSSNAVLTVALNPRIVSVKNVGDTEVHVVWTRPVELFEGTYEFDNGIFENLRAYGSNHNEVVITTDPMLSGVTYTLTITGVSEEGNISNLQLPNPDSRAFRPGYGSFCTDFAALPGGAVIGGQAAVAGGFLHINDAGNPGGNGWFFAPDPNAGFPVDRLVVTYKTLIGRPDANRPADGYSFNIGADINSGTQPGEEGYGGQGLTVSFDTWDNNGADTAPAIEIFYKNALVVSRSFAGVREGNRAPAGPFLYDINGSPLALDTSNTFVNVRLSVGPDGKLDFYFKDYLIFQNVQLPNYSGFQNANISIGGRVGGANENHWIDDLCVNSFSIGAPVITGPANTTVPELRRAKFQIDVNGLPPYAVQWYSNNVAIAGANALVYDTPVLTRTADGAQYFAVVSNSFNTVTSSVAILSIVLDNIAPTIVSAAAIPDNSGTYSTVRVRFSETLDPASANNSANYTINNGGAVSAATLQSDGVTVLLQVTGLNKLDHTVLSVNGVKDVSTYNAVSATKSIVIPAPVLAVGAQNLLVVEAEDYNFATSGANPVHQWVFNTDVKGAAGTFSGTGDMESVPNTGVGAADNDLNTPRMDYYMNFPAAGTYYVWVRYVGPNGSDNSFHIGVDGAESPTGLRVGNNINNNRYEWNNFNNAGGAARVEITNAGIHTFSVWMREDGTRVDKILLTTDAAFTFADLAEPGPGSTREASTPAIRTARANDGSVTVTWAGAGWTLQGTTQLNTNAAQNVWENLPYPSGTVIPPGYFGTGPTNVFFRLFGQ